MFQSTRPWGRERSRFSTLVRRYVVSIHAPVGARTMVDDSVLRTHVVSIHAPVGARTTDGLSSVASARLMFQSTRPWGREPASCGPACFLNVSIHAPVGARTMLKPASTWVSSWFQSTRPWGREHSRPIYWPLPALIVSIHAPVGARTKKIPATVQLTNVSIHAPVGARTRSRRQGHWSWIGFNPRARGGANMCAVSNARNGVHRLESTRPWGREPAKRALRCQLAVSIHAPVGARTEGEVMSADD